jgi:hypothetical protein
MSAGNSGVSPTRVVAWALLKRDKDEPAFIFPEHWLSPNKDGLQNVLNHSTASSAGEAVYSPRLVPLVAGTVGAEACEAPSLPVTNLKPQYPAWMHEFTDPHTGQRAREPRLHRPADYELQPGDTVRPLVYADDVPALDASSSSREPPRD